MNEERTKIEQLLTELAAAASEIAELLPKFKDGGNISGLFLESQDEAMWRRKALHAKHLASEAVGALDDLTFRLGTLANANRGLSGGPSFADVQEATQLVMGVIDRLGRPGARLPVSTDDMFRNLVDRGTLTNRATTNSTTNTRPPYVDPSRLSQLDALRSQRWDFQRLVALCREIDRAAANECWIAVACLVRAVLDHVPPVFDQESFSAVANNYDGGRSFKEAMQHLEGASRKIADQWLHQKIRQREALPNSTQVNFSPQLDLLLSEIVRVAAKS